MKFRAFTFRVSISRLCEHVPRPRGRRLPITRVPPATPGELIAAPGRQAIDEADLATDGTHLM